MSTSKRTISAAEVKEWVGPTSASRLRPSQYKKIAARLTAFRWYGEAPSPSVVGSRAIGPDDRWWDIDATARAAQKLRASIPKMLSFQDGLRWAPETRYGYEAIRDLDAVLTRALPFIESPFGEGPRVRGQKKRKEWHIYAILISRIMIQELQDAGNEKTGLSRNSIIVRVIQEALRRMKVPPKTLADSTIAAYISRWNKHPITTCGLATKPDCVAL